MSLTYRLKKYIKLQENGAIAQRGQSMISTIALLRQSSRLLTTVWIEVSVIKDGRWRKLQQW